MTVDDGDPKNAPVVPKVVVIEFDDESLITCPFLINTLARAAVLWNALLPMVIPLVQSVDAIKVTDVRLEALLKALATILVTDAGMTMEVIAVCRNAEDLISVIFSGNSMEVSAVSRNAVVSMVNSSLPAAKVTDARLEHL